MLWPESTFHMSEMCSTALLFLLTGFAKYNIPFEVIGYARYASVLMVRDLPPWYTTAEIAV